MTNLTRRSTRSSEPIEVDRIIKYDKKLSEFSDEDDVSVKKESSEDQFREFGGAIGAFVLMLFFPIYVFGLHIFCNESSCSFKLGVNYKQSLNLEKFFDLKSCLIYVGYALFVGILSIIPFGGKKIAGLPNKNGKLQYVTNGLFITCSLLVFCYVLEYRKIPVFLYLTKNYLRFLLPSLIFGIAFCLLGYYHSFYVPVSALSQSSMVNSKIYNIFMGREVNPRFFGILDTKVFFIRLSLIASVSIRLNRYLILNNIFAGSP